MNLRSGVTLGMSRTAVNLGKLFCLFFAFGWNTTTYRNQCLFAAAKSLQSCPTLRDPRDGSPPDSLVPGILQGKHTGVGCHCLLQCIKVNSESKVAQSCPTLSDPMECSPPGPTAHGAFSEWLFTSHKKNDWVWPLSMTQISSFVSYM